MIGVGCVGLLVLDQYPVNGSVEIARAIPQQVSNQPDPCAQIPQCSLAGVGWRGAGSRVATSVAAYSRCQVQFLDPAILTFGVGMKLRNFMQVETVATA